MNVLLRPLDGGASRWLAQLQQGSVLGLDWASDGRTPALVHTRVFSDAVLITGLPATED